VNKQIRCVVGPPGLNKIKQKDENFVEKTGRLTSLEEVIDQCVVLLFLLFVCLCRASWLVSGGDLVKQCDVGCPLIFKI
jgi:hypothetical protein